MAILYRTTGAWGSGTGVNLTDVQVDQNFWAIQQALNSLNAALSAGTAVSIAGFTVLGNQLTINMTDSTTRGPFTLPTATWNFRGNWAPSTMYAVNDVVSEGGSLYLVAYAHTSATTFDAGANDGAGHDYYQLMLSIPGNVIPSAGTTGQVLAKVSDTSFDVAWAGSSAPAGGTIGQVLAKTSDDDYSIGWVTPDEVPVGGTAGQFLSTQSVDDDLVVTWVLPSLSDLDDVVLTSPADDDVMTYSGATSKFVNKPAVAQDSRVVILGASGSVTLDPTTASVFNITPTADVAIASTVVGARGRLIAIVITTSGTTSFNITFTTHFKSAGAYATGDVSATKLQIVFLGDGGNFNEVSRSAAGLV